MNNFKAAAFDMTQDYATAAQSSLIIIRSSAMQLFFVPQSENAWQE